MLALLYIKVSDILKNVIFADIIAAVVRKTKKIEKI